MAFVKLAMVLAVLVAVAGVSQGAVFGAGNVMYRRYPNGPKEFQVMKPTIWKPSVPSRTPVAGTNQARPVLRTGVDTSSQDNSWMFDKAVNRRVVKGSFY